MRKSPRQKRRNEIAENIMTVVVLLGAIVFFVTQCS